jgi:hypothetical protein
MEITRCVQFVGSRPDCSAMPQRFFSEQDLRIYGVTGREVRGRERGALETWRLPDVLARTLRALLARTGFDPNTPIHVHEATNARGFFFTQ